jgi:hypothetical protein
MKRKKREKRRKLAKQHTMQQAAKRKAGIETTPKVERKQPRKDK